ncbi:response regulator [Spirosoma fluviale]|uniref:Response regulator receiver domain-containing protein n=1 Tax=Spirosoma fluviale TaxID=1597977 RepID=A0A286GAE1_9BACT|nr:response regulator [Spirosoma fluviale]SOD92119.1 Response regulator receiver domain-containing protein [Spirosoma fluviale]
MKNVAVDDEAQMKQLFDARFRRELSNGEVHLTFARSVEEALNVKPGSGVVLILLAINLPGISGLELLRRTRETHLHRPPAVMITAYPGAAPLPADRQQATRYGADVFLTKPIAFKRLGKLSEFVVDDEPSAS